MKLVPLEQTFSVCKMGAMLPEDPGGALLFTARTSDEVSLVCETAHVPAGAIAVEHGWRALRVAGALDFGMVGVIAGISAALAARQIPIFVVSTFDTDYILLKADRFSEALETLEANGYTIGGNP